ncbi:MAG: hypothetical protein RML56_12425 [Burkholderiales bacterium]|nr:hypothetical protein [Burkholderiales bacterium]
MAHPLAHRLLLGFSLVVTLTCAAPQAFPAPRSRDEALAALDSPAAERRAEAIVWIANHGTMADQPLLLARLRDESPFVRGFAEQGLWLLWSRSGETEIDRLMAAGVEDLQAGRYGEAIAAFNAVIRRRPDYVEGWNRRASAYFSLATSSGRSPTARRCCAATRFTSARSPAAARCCCGSGGKRRRSPAGAARWR